MGVYKKVLEYSINFVQDIACLGTKATDNMSADAEALALLSCSMVFTRATNGVNYWYCFFIDNDDVDIAKRILQMNSVPVLKHSSMYNYYKQPVLRVTCSALEKNPSAKAFVKKAMAIKYNENINLNIAHGRISVLKEKVK